MKTRWSPVRFKTHRKPRSAILDAIGFTSVITNLIENAIKYSEPDTEVRIKLHSDNSNVFLEVADNGSGIPENEKGKVFDKFYRVGNEDTRKTKGTGLGLYIVQHIVKMHNGKIEVRNNHPSGTVFEIRLPVV